MRISDWSSDVCSSDLGILIRLEPAETVADHEAAPDFAAVIRPRAMRGRAKKAYRRSRFARGDDRRPKIRFRHSRGAVAVRVNVGRAIVGGERRQRPDDIDEKFLLALGAGPHVMIAMRKLPNFAGVDFDGLCDFELDAVGAAAETSLDRGQDDLVLDRKSTRLNSSH